MKGYIVKPEGLFAQRILQTDSGVFVHTFTTDVDIALTHDKEVYDSLPEPHYYLFVTDEQVKNGWFNYLKSIV